MNLLIVNDEILTADTMKMDMDWEAYGISKVFVAYNANDAKICITENHIDILLCDIEMPEEDGISLTRWVKENKREIEVIFLTCHANFEYAKEAIELGCRNYILIPAKYAAIGSEIYKVAKGIKKQREEEKYQEYGRQVVKEKKSALAEKFGEKKTPEELVAETVLCIAQNLGNEELSVNYIADQLYLSPIYLNRIFKNEKEISIGKYIIRERMKMAASLLTDGGLSASIVAEQVGYSSYPSFNTMFKRYYGCTPAQYQEER